MIRFLIVGSGFLMSKFPYPILGIFICLLAKLYLFFPSRRKRLLLSNLTHAFPDWSYTQIKSTALESTIYLFEMGFFSLIYPHLSKYGRRSTLVYPKDTDRLLAELRQNGEPVLFLLPHVTLFESLATSSAFRPFNGKTLGAIYRPNSNPSLDSWVNNSRLNLGINTFSRKKGLIQARKYLTDNNWLVLLFDQNAGLNGELSLFIDRLCSITPLPDILLKGINAKVILAYPVRLSLFRARLNLYELGQVPIGEVSKTAHKKLEVLIKNHSKGLPEWLWSHGKWKTQDHARQIFNLNAKRNSLPVRGKVPRKTKFWIRMPNWLGDVVMSLPFIKAIEHGRPDAEITLLCQAQFKPLLMHLKVGHDIIALPRKGVNYFLKIWSLRTRYPDVHFLFTNSLRGDIEARLIGSTLRLGGSIKKNRKLLTHQAIISKDFEKRHQVELWHEYLKYFGLKEVINYSPLISNNTSHLESKVICLAPGSSNSPEKRWPIQNWLDLIRYLSNRLPDYKFKLIGTSKDSVICKTIALASEGRNVFDHSGTTNLVQLCEIFQKSSAIICNDSGAMHLANCLGLPVVALFGPTRPSVTGPIYEARTSIQCGDSNSMNEIEPKAVVNETCCLLDKEFK